MTAPADRNEVAAAMRACARRHKFSMIELHYIMGRARTRAKDPWDTDKLAQKLGVEPSTLLLYEAMLIEQAVLQNPLLHSFLHTEREANERLGESITQEQRRRDSAAAIVEDRMLSSSPACGKTDPERLEMALSVQRGIQLIDDLREKWIDLTQYPRMKKA